MKIHKETWTQAAHRVTLNVQDLGHPLKGLGCLDPKESLGDFQQSGRGFREVLSVRTKEPAQTSPFTCVDGSQPGPPSFRLKTEEGRC